MILRPFGYFILQLLGINIVALLTDSLETASPYPIREAFARGTSPCVARM